MKYPLFKVRMSSDVTSGLNYVFNSGWIGEGQFVKGFEYALSAYIGAKSIAVNSCTSALSMAFQHVSKTCHTVLTPPLTCFATTAAIMHAGLKIKWLDIDPKTLNADLTEIDKKYEDGCAISLVHFAGRPCPLPSIAAPIVEDCAHAFGAPVGKSSSTYACFSFQAVKTLTTGDGGLLVPPPDLYDYFVKNRWYGMDRSLPRDQDITEAGFKYHMNDINASIGLANFHLALDSVELQKANAKFYTDNLSDLCLEFSPESSYWLFPLMVDEKENFIRHLASHNIAANPAHFRNDHNSCVRQYQTDLPGMDLVEQKMVCIPNGWWIDPEAREFIVDVIKKGW